MVIKVINELKMVSVRISVDNPPDGPNNTVVIRVLLEDTFYL